MCPILLCGCLISLFLFPFSFFKNWILVIYLISKPLAAVKALGANSGKTRTQDVAEGCSGSLPIIFLMLKRVHQH